MIIKTDGSIEINGKATGLRVVQGPKGTIVFSEKQHDITYPMPYARYSLSHNAPRSIHATPALAAKHKTVGRSQFETDIKSLLGSKNFRKNPRKRKASKKRTVKRNPSRRKGRIYPYVVQYSDGGPWIARARFINEVFAVEYAKALKHVSKVKRKIRVIKL